MRIPKFLTLRRKYEIDESMGLVKFSRAHFGVLIMIGIRMTAYGRTAEAAVVPQSRKLVSFGHSAGQTLVREASKPVLFLQWGRVPKDWELSFVAKMKSAESQGIPFTQVLQADLPLVLGEVPSDVLLRWVGRRARSQPKQFVKIVGKMFGPSGKRIITGLEGRLDPEKLLEVEKDPDEPFQSLIEAIQRADAGKPNATVFLDKDRWKHFKA